MKKHMMTVLLVLLMMVFPATVFAADAGSVTYNGSKLVNEFKTIDVSDMQPGDSQTYTIKIKNDSKDETDWWISNEVLQTLEESANASGGAYTYILQYNGTDIYNNDTVGGENTDHGVGLKNATNAMEDFFFLDTLAPGGTGEVTLTVALDGESQGNSYQDAAGEIQLVFGVEPRETVQEEPVPPKKHTPDQKVKTGDDSNMMPYYIVAIVAGLTLLLLALGRMKRTRKEDGAND